MKLTDIRMFFFLLAVIVVVVLVVAPVHASGTDIEQTTTVDQVIGGDSSKALGLGFSYALGDVDLNEGRNCYVSTASGNIIFGRQKVELNPWCAALFYDANRKHKFAAKLRCQLEDIIVEYTSKPDCVKDQTLAPREVTSSPALDAIVAQYQEDEDERDAKYEELQQQVEKLEARRTVQPRPQIIQQQPAYSEEQRAEVAAIFGREREK